MEVSEDLGSWNPVPTTRRLGTAADGSLEAALYLKETPSTRRFYRIAVGDIKPPSAR